jgi:phosphoribosylamine--glycine ligase/phosphoribosylformylglycinamidine cyclo-ligase
MIAQAMNKHDTVGIDLVAMNVNDLVVQGAEPLMFLDYYGCSQLKLENAAAFVEGVAAGCIQSKCALVGGETAEMPGMYQRDDYDAAGAAIGTMSKDLRLPQKEQMVEGDILLGLASSGVHSNGFSLVRRILEREKVSYSDIAPWDNSTTVGLSLLTPTKIYVCPLLNVINKGLVKGLSHITGGGLLENVPRMLPQHLSAEIDVSTWQLPAVFKWLKRAGNVASEEMARSFNTGVGMVAVVSGSNAQQAIKELEAAGETVFTVGKLVPRTGSDKGCVLKNLSSWD